MAIIELADKCTSDIDKNEDLFNELINAISLIENKRNQMNLVFWNFQYQLLRVLGFKPDFNKTELDFYRLLDDLEDMFQFKAEEQKLRLLFERSPNVPQYIRTDQVKLRQVLINLINNALKFTEEGGVSLRVRGESLNFMETNDTKET